jgi:hypothetical protein
MNAIATLGCRRADGQPPLVGVQVGVGVHVGVGMVVQVVLGADSPSLIEGDGTPVTVVVLGVDAVSVGMEDTALRAVGLAAVGSAEVAVGVSVEVLVTTSIGEALVIDKSAHRRTKSKVRHEI